MFNYKKSDYESAIPKCCGAGKTWNEHWEVLMLCWGLLDCMEAKRSTENLCINCEYRRHD